MASTSVLSNKGAPSNSMASTSSLLSNQKRFKYEVFLSFRGEDTRHNFLDRLYRALTHQGIDTYKDDVDITKGKRISEQLIRSIEDSKLYIIVFSPNYASSSWCLDELVKIMECQEEMEEHTAYPVFYHVEPTHIRKQTGEFGKTFSKHKNHESYKKWRKALTEAASLAGWALETTDDEREAELIQKIVKDISLALCYNSWSADPKLVGMEKRVADVVSSLEVGVDDVRMIGIKGIGGGGKTTLAKAVFDQIAYSYEGSSFVLNVRDTTKVYGLIHLQKQVLSNVLNVNASDINVNGFSDFKSMMKKTMCGRKILLVLDDVDHIDQLDALAGGADWFKPGSRVIITTRDEQVLLVQGVPKNLILNVNLLSHDEALHLFIMYAFGSEILNHGFELLSDRALRYANGLPLTIKVLGSFLRGKDIYEWNDALERLKEIPLKDTLDILELSYNSLEEDYKEIFLDVACILKGRRKADAIMALESCGFHARIGLKVLEQKSLISVTDHGYLSVHEHLEELAKNIVSRQHPNEPNKHSRLWIEEENKDILVNDKETKAIRCIWVVDVDPLSVMKGLRKMKGLKILMYQNARIADISFPNWDDISEDDLFLPDSLQYLSWTCYPFSCLPRNFQANNLVGLDLYSSKIDQLYEGGERKDLSKLRFIAITTSTLKTLDMGLFSNLKTITLQFCNRLVEIHMPVEMLKLEHLTFAWCSKLKTLNLTGALNLNNLDLYRCMDLLELHMPAEMLKLERIQLVKCSNLKTLNLTGALNLNTMRLKNCKDLLELYMPVEMLKLTQLSLVKCSNLKTLNLTGALNLNTMHLEECKDLLELYMPVEMLKLTKLSLVKCSNLKTFNLTGALNLNTMHLEECKDLLELYMPVEMLKLTKLSLVKCSNLKTLNLTGALNLNTMRLKECKDLLELYMPVEMLKLEWLRLYQCSKLKTLDLSEVWNLDSLTLEKCDDMVKLHMPLSSLNLKHLNLKCSKLKALDLTRALYLESINLLGCDDLEEVRMPVENVHLKSLRISCSKMRTTDLPHAEKMEVLVLWHSKLETLDLGWAQHLVTLNLFECENLVEINIPLESTSLKHLSVKCSKLKALDLTRTVYLESINLLGCDDLEEVRMPVENVHLKSLCISCSKMRTMDLPHAEKMEVLVLWHSKLETLDLGWAQHLITLTLFECENLVEINMPLESTSLKHLSVKCSKLKALDLTRTVSLESINLLGCDDLEEVRMPVENVHLKSLCISCSKMRTTDLPHAEKMEVLVLWHSKLETLDLGWAQHLVTLTLFECENLVEINIPLESTSLKHLSVKCSKLKAFDLTRTVSLESINLLGCGALEEVHMPDENVHLKSLRISCSKMRTMDLPHAEKMEVLVLWHSKLETLDLGWAQHLITLTLFECENLVEINMPLESTSLKHLSVKCSKLKALDLTRTVYLESINLLGCDDLEEVRMPVENVHLKSLCISCSKMRTMDLPHAEKMEVLVLWHSKLETLDLGWAQHLITLTLFECENLVEINMPLESISLKHLRVKCSKLKSLDLTRAVYLKSINLLGCNDLEEVCMPVENAHLISLRISCSKMRTTDLPHAEKMEDLVLLHSKLRTLDLGWAQYLVTLYLFKCENLVEINMPLESISLKHLSVKCSKLKALDLKRAVFLESINLLGCDDLEEVHMPVENVRLKSLRISYAKMRTMDLPLAENITDLVICRSNLRTLPDLGWARNLEALAFDKCENLVETRIPLENINLKSLYLRRCKLKTLNLILALNLQHLYLEECVDLRTLYLGQSRNLWSLVLKECYNLVEISAPIGCLKDRVTIHITGCVSLNPFLVNYGSPMVLHELHLSTTFLHFGCPLHHDILHTLKFECIYKEPLPSLSGNPGKYIYLLLCPCTSLASFSGSTYGVQSLRKLTLQGSFLEVPKELELLECLEELILECPDIVKLPASICMLKRLKVLRLKCLLLEQLPEDIGRLKCLEELQLSECTSLQDIPNSICEMKRLACFNLRYCTSVKKLPVEIGQLKCLKELNIEFTDISHLPQSIFQLKGLLIFGSKWRLESYGFTSVMENSSGQTYCYI